MDSHLAHFLLGPVCNKEREEGRVKSSLCACPLEVHLTPQFVEGFTYR